MVTPMVETDSFSGGGRVREEHLTIRIMAKPIKLILTSQL